MNKLWSPWRSQYIDSFLNKEKSDGCILCNIAKKNPEDPSNLLIEKGDLTFTVLNLYPYNNGHLMIIPFEHKSEIESLTREENAEIMEKLQLAARLQVLFWLAVGLSSLAAFSTAVHHFEKRFVRAALCLLLVPTSTVVAAVLLASQLGVASLALGYLTGTILHCLILLPGSVDSLDFQPSVSPHLGREFAARLFPVLITLLPFTALPVIDAFWSSHLPDGSLSYLGYATRIVIGLTSVTIHGVAVVLFPYFSEHAVAGQRERLRAMMISSLKFVFLLMVPLATILTALRLPILTLLFERGSFDRQATLGLGAVLPWYLAGMVGMAAMNIVSRAFYAVSQARTLVLIGLGSLALYAGLSGLLSRSFSYAGIGVSYALYWTVQLIIAGAALGFVVEKLWCVEQFKFLLKLVTASLLVGALLQRASILLPEAMGPVARVLLLGTAGCVVFLLMAWLSFTAAEKLDFRSLFAARETVPSGEACITNSLVARSDTR